MKACNGPCEQGRKPCPCPLACEEPLDNDHGLEALGFIVAGIAIIVLAIIGVGALVGHFWR